MLEFDLIGVIDSCFCLFRNVSLFYLFVVFDHFLLER